MSDRDALFRSILAAPDDDAPRLIFADYLEEQGEEARAEYIRLQCRMANIPTNTVLHRPLATRCKQLENAHLAEWEAAFQPMCWRAEHRRGFLDGVRLLHSQFIQFGDTLQQMAPIRVWEFRSHVLASHGVDNLTLHDAVHHRHFDGVRDIEIGYHAAEELITEIIDTPYRSQLRALTLNDTYIHGRTLQRLYDVLPDLCEITAMNTSARLLAPLWRGGAKHRLRRLELVGCKVSNDALAALAQAKALERLESLWLDNNPFDDRGVDQLMQSPYLRNLRELSLAHVMIGNEVAIRLAKSPLLQHVRVLNLVNCGLDSSGCQALADSPYLTHLECLCLDQNRVSITVENELRTRFGASCVSIGW